MIPVWSPDAKALASAASALGRGELIGMPTETVYGLAGNALDAKALARIFAVKRRPFFDPLIVHVASRAQIDKLVSDIPSVAHRLMEAFWPGPLTLVLPRSGLVPDLATAGLSTVALRIPRHPVAQALLQACGFPLAAPSANPFGGLSPTRSEHVASAFSEGIAAVLEGGPCKVGVESSIVGFESGRPVLLRAGGVSLEALRDCLGFAVKVASHSAEKGGEASENRPAMAPGLLPWHYAPATPLRLIASATDLSDRQGRGLLSFRGMASTRGYAAVEILSPSGDLEEAAARLFACLHRLDAQGLRGIDAEILPAQGLGLAMMDRLQKAAAKP